MRRAVLLAVVVGILLFFVGPAWAADKNVEGLCPGYKLSIVQGHSLAVKNGPRLPTSTGTCKTGLRWDSLLISGMCKGMTYTANGDRAGNLVIGCRK